MPDSPNDYFTSVLRSKVRAQAQISMKAVTQQAIIKGTARSAEVMAAFLDGMSVAYTRRRGMISMHRQVGQQAQQKVLEAYERRVKRIVPPYRESAPEPWRRYAGGKMQEAITDPRFYVGRYDGLDFINMDVMDLKAKQWYRLNFGAGSRGRGGNQAQQYQLRFGEAVVPFNLSQFRASGNFNMPAGLFSDGNKLFPPSQRFSDPTTQQFFPFGFLKLSSRFNADSARFGPGRRRIRTRGIQGAHFFDPGIRYVAGALPRVWRGLQAQWFEEAIRGVGPIAKANASINGQTAADLLASITDY